MTLDQLQHDPAYAEHHTAAARGYVSRRGGAHVLPYVGRFGKGYKVIRPRWDTSQYVWVTYYIRQEG